MTAADKQSKNVAISRHVTSQYQGARYRQETVVENIHVPLAEPLLLQLEHFVKCIRENRPPIVTVEDGLKAMRYAAQIVELVHRIPQPTYPVTPMDATAATALAPAAAKG